MELKVDVTAWIDGAELVVKDPNDATLTVLTQAEGKGLVVQLIAALSIAKECDMIAESVIRDHYEFGRKIEVQSE